MLKAWNEYEARIITRKKEGSTILQKNNEHKEVIENDIEMEEIEIQVRGTKRKAYKQLTKEVKEEKKKKKVMEHVLEVLLQETFKAITILEKQKKQPTLKTIWKKSTVLEQATSKENRKTVKPRRRTAVNKTVETTISIAECWSNITTNTRGLKRKIFQPETSSNKQARICTCICKCGESPSSTCNKESPNAPFI